MTGIQSVSGADNTESVLEQKHQLSVLDSVFLVVWGKLEFCGKVIKTCH